MEHRFWSTQPVPQEQPADGVVPGPLRDDDASKVRPQPLGLPADFTWCTIDITHDDELSQLHDLLTAHYVEDVDALFRFAYSASFLRWALAPPGYHKNWHVGVRVKATNKLVAFISAVPLSLRILDALPKAMAEVNFLCIHKKLRDKRLAPVLIREVTRRVNLVGIFQAIYTAGVRIPSPIATVRYYHRNLNPIKLLETRFSHLPRHLSLQDYQRRYKLPEKPTLKLREMTIDDVTAVCSLLNQSLHQRCKLHPVFDELHAKHWLAPHKDVVWAWVIDNPDENATLPITDYVSFYSLPSSVIGHPVHSDIRAAYLYYHASTSSDPEHTQELIRNTLIHAKRLGFDVFNALALMNNQPFMEPLKFAPGDGYLNYYLFNWKCPGLQPADVGLTML